jgi:hypothetical protein
LKALYGTIRTAWLFWEWLSAQLVEWGFPPDAYDSCWQKLHSHAYTHAMVCSFVSFTRYLIYLRRWIAKKIHLWCCLFASFVSLSQLINSDMN